MRIHAIIHLWVVFLCCFVIAGGLHAQPRVEYLNGPEAYLGNVHQSREVEYEFVMRVLEDTLFLSAAKPSCLCTTTAVSDSIVPPGNVFSIRVKLSAPKGSRGPMSKFFKLFRRGENQPFAKLLLHATITSAFSISTPVIRFDSVALGTEKLFEIWVGNTEAYPVSIERLEALCAYYTGSRDVVHRQTIGPTTLRVTDTIIAPLDSVKLTIGFRPEIPGELQGSILIGNNDSEIHIFLEGSFSDQTHMKQTKRRD